MHARFVPRRRRRFAAWSAAITLVLTLPASALGSHGPHPTPASPYLTLTAAAAGGQVRPLINSGDTFHDVMFRGIPDGIGVVPGTGWVDLYVAHEESHVPFGLTSTTVFADTQDSSVSRVRVDLATKQVIDLQVALPHDAGFIRFCSAFMAGPDQGFADYTFFVNEESNDVIPVPDGATYGADPNLAPERQAGYSVFLNTETGEYSQIARMGRHNHENTVVVPGGWKQLAVLSGDDTFTAPSSQLYLYTAKDANALMADKGQLWAFQVTATDDGAVDPFDPLNDANDYLEIGTGDTWSGRFIHVPNDIARGVTDEDPQTALENWSNDNNVFQFIRVEDISYDPEDPSTVFFADTGAAVSEAASGRLVAGGAANRGRLFKMVLNDKDPRIVDEFSVVLDATTQFLPDPVTGTLNQRVNRPDNIDVTAGSIMVQEDTTNAKVWRYDRSDDAWSWVATVTHPTAPADGESSGIVDVSKWFGAGWWALDVQSHVPVPGTVGPFQTWNRQPTPPGGNQYRERLEDGQLLLIQIPGS
jgi:uncharacterized protein DUF839